MLHQTFATSFAHATEEHRHRPRRSTIRQDGDLKRAICTTCGCALVRTQATRLWFHSGPLG